MTEKEARVIAERHIRALDKYGQYDLVIVAEETITRPYGWIYFYATREFIETGNILHALGGNGPVVVESQSGRATSLPSNQSVEESIRQYELTR